MLRVRVDWNGAFPGVPYFTNLYFGGSDDPAAEAAGTAVANWLNSIDTAYTTSLTATIRPDVDLVNPATGETTQVFDINTDVAVPGASTGEQLPPNSQGLIRWRTGVFIGGREIRGRTFVPGAVEGHNVLGAPNSVYLGIIGTACAALRTDGIAAGGFGIYSQTHNQFQIAQSHSVWAKWATLRSRRD
jgi:hypothetical protein